MIRTAVKNEGFEGILFGGNGQKDKVVIVMSGSNGGMRLTRTEAEFYHRNGVPALALGLFKTKQTQKDLDRVPVEYVERAVKWLKNQGYQKIAIDGTSKGSEMALIAASMFSDISCVIARVPSYFVSEGLTVNGVTKSPSGTSCWSYHGKELPYAPYRSRTFDFKTMLKKEKEFHILTFNKNKVVTPETIIPIEKIMGPILFISSKHDVVWESYKSCVIMDHHLTDVSFPFKHKHIAFPYLSHAMVTNGSPLFRIGFKSEKEHPKQCAQEREKLKKVLLDWVQHEWEAVYDIGNTSPKN